MRIRRRFAVAALALGLFSGGFAIAQASWAVPGTVPAQQQESAARVAPASGRPTGRPTSTVQARDDHDPGPVVPGRRRRRGLGYFIVALVVAGGAALFSLLRRRGRSRRLPRAAGQHYGQAQHPQAVYGQPPQPGASPPPGSPQAPPPVPYPQAPYPQ
ncbi:MAG: hypothetical protein Q4E05_10015, partial [Pseudoclavibacter sp.]|nr:hypothetical protein [Pseudoclavibacter sp.]